MSGYAGLDRRRFLQVSAAAAGVGFWGAAQAAETNAANGKLNIACIGTANRATSNINGVAGEKIVALCDVDTNYLDKAKERFSDARAYVDYRELLDREGDRIDAVVISTPDHQHAPPAIRALRRGLHVYCEKPLSHTVEEARLLAQEAKKQGVATQMGTQIHAGENYRRVVEAIQAGAIGDVREAHVWVGKGWGGGERPEKAEEPPKHLAWDLWLGPAPERHYASGRYHTFNWRRWWDFGQGTLGDMACHFMDLPFWALKLRHPTRVEAEGPEVHPETCPLGLIVRYEFPEREGLPPVKLTWYDGNLTPKQLHGQPMPGNGVLFVGSEGMMFADYGSFRLYPQQRAEGFQPPPQTIARSPGHYNEWITACKTGSPTTCNFDYSGALTETVLLGNVAFRAGQGFTWNGEALKAEDAPAADAFVRKEYREGWGMQG